ncbi:hypothetical protein SAMN05216503_0750 [Polaribacter sp. KT25b]|uniref:DUF6090 family protein n=1 Tax=Polaribacter sp. KT25b TaxID=1855336 RepID=UPI00087AB6BC|nr:DUF6090 family protein [Polaribacter sp. KT25b]SDR75233.1 hypothetical protein SAMN05216503_0750 [Polaribacter sp. KT25b]
MIKIFRNIRHNLLNEGKNVKYFKYAIGEIFLVVIGILIALQINNWNENRKSDAIRKNYYAQILQDLGKDYIFLRGNISWLNANITLYKKYQEDFAKQKSVKDLIIRSGKLNYYFKYIKFNVNTIETLQNTGDIKLIPTEIRNKLIDLKRLQDIQVNTASGNYDSFMKEFMNATKLGFMPNVFDKLIKSNQSNQLYKDLKVEDNFSKIALIINSAYSLKDITEQEQLKSSTLMLASINNLFNLINEELGNPYANIESVTNSLLKLETLIESGKTIDEIIAVIKKQDKNAPVYDISESYINALGYWYINTAKNNKDALKIFKLNTELYPKAWNTYDSYGECLLLLGDTENGIKAYKKSLELNPKNQSALKVLSKLKVDN